MEMPDPLLDQFSGLMLCLLAQFDFGFPQPQKGLKVAWIKLNRFLSIGEYQIPLFVPLEGGGAVSRDNMVSRIKSLNSLVRIH